jgi:hypothetical protein
MNAFVYCWTDHAHGKLYLGSHKGTLDDGYICSSKMVKEQMAIRPQDFTRQIIAVGTFSDMRMLEEVILKTVNAKHDPQFYNLHNCDGDFYNKGHAESTKKKIGIANTGKVRTSEQRKANSIRKKQGYAMGVIKPTRFNLGKTYEEIMGPEKGAMLRITRANARLGKPSTSKGITWKYPPEALAKRIGKKRGPYRKKIT